MEQGFRQGYRIHRYSAIPTDSTSADWTTRMESGSGPGEACNLTRPGNGAGADAHADS